MSRRKGSNQLTVSDEKQLLVHSSLINQHEYLMPAMSKFDKISKSDLENPDYIDYFPKDVASFFMYSFDTLIGEAEKEWEQDSYCEEIPIGQRACELCGYARLKFLHKIRNNITSKELHVGSECISKFNNIYKSAEVSQAVKVKKRDAAALRRQANINEKIPDIKNMLDDWHKKLHDNPIVLPTYLEESIRKLLNAASSLYEEYVSGKSCETSVFYEINKIIPQIDASIQEMEAFNKENQNKPYVCTKAYKDWIDKIHPDKSNVIMGKIKENCGMLCNETVKYLHYVPFVKTQLKLMEDVLAKHKLFLVSDDDDLKFKYAKSDHFSFVMKCGYGEFMLDCAELNNSVFSIKMDSLLEKLKFDDHTVPVNFINELIRNKGYRIYYHDESKKWFVIRNNDRLCCPIDISFYLKSINPEFHIKSDDELSDILTRIIKMIKKWKPLKELTEIDERFIEGEHSIYRRPRR